MTADLYRISGLHDHGLAAFAKACGVVDANLRREHEQSERLLREVRRLLGRAHQLEVAGDIEYADAHGAVAANKLAQAISVSERA